MARYDGLLGFDRIAGVVGDGLQIQPGQVLVLVDLHLRRRLIQGLWFPDGGDKKAEEAQKKRRNHNDPLASA
jgi:hypothetical protein